MALRRSPRGRALRVSLRQTFLLVLLAAALGTWGIVQWQRSRDPRAALRGLSEEELVDRVARAEDALACLQLAERYQRAGKIAEAAGVLEKAVSWQPRLAEAHKQLGVCLAQLGDHKRALASLRRAAALAPSDWEVFFYLGTVYQYAGRYLDGARAFEKAAALNPRVADAHLRAGHCYAAATFFDRAAAAVKRALALEPRNHEARFLLGQSYWWQSRFEEARQEVAEAVRLQPDNAEYRQTLGFIYADLPDTEANRRAALQHLSRALELNPRSGVARYRRGTVYRRLGRWREAVAEWEEAAALQPSNPEVRFALGQGYQQLGRKREADEQFALFRKLQAEAKKEKTLNYLRREALLRPDDAEAHYRLGVFYEEQLGDVPKAIAQFREAVRLSPQHAQAKGRLERLTGKSP